MNNPTSLLPAVPPQMPQVKPNAFLRWLARCTLRMGGWKVTGTLPDIPRLVFIIAPHSSNWDGLWGMAAKIALGMKVKVLGKASLFWWPLGPLLHKLGVIPLDRSSPQGTVGQAVDLLRKAGMAKAAKKAGRSATEGIVCSLVEDGLGVLVEVLCETDFVAKTDRFKEYASGLAEKVAREYDTDGDLSEAVAAAEKDTLTALIGVIGENMQIRRVHRWQTGGKVASYLHMGGRSVS